MLGFKGEKLEEKWFNYDRNETIITVRKAGFSALGLGLIFGKGKTLGNDLSIDRKSASAKALNTLSRIVFLFSFLLPSPYLSLLLLIKKDWSKDRVKTEPFQSLVLFWTLFFIPGHLFRSWTGIIIV